MSELTIEQRVAAGAEWLDKNRPTWILVIDLDILDISDSCRCVLGQVYGNYFRSPSEARFVPDAGPFVADDRGFSGVSRYALRALTEEWCRVIAARREAGERS